MYVKTLKWQRHNGKTTRISELAKTDFCPLVFFKNCWFGAKCARAILIQIMKNECSAMNADETLKEDPFRRKGGSNPSGPNSLNWRGTFATSDFDGMLSYSSWHKSIDLSHSEWLIKSESNGNYVVILHMTAVDGQIRPALHWRVSKDLPRLLNLSDSQVMTHLVWLMYYLGYFVHESLSWHCAQRPSSSFAYITNDYMNSSFKNFIHVISKTFTDSYDSFYTPT